MRIFTTALLSAGLMLGTASLAQAQLGDLKDAATKAATDAVKDKMLGETAAPQPKGISTPLGDVSTDALGDTGLGSITSTDLSTDETITAGKVLLGGGSTTDVAKKIGTDRAKARGEELLNEQVNSAAQSFGSGKSYEAAPAETHGSGTSYETAPVQSQGSGTSYQSAPVQAPAAAINCPSGTKAQADGTCMVTGNWGG